MRVYDDICDMLNRELEQIAQKKELTSNALDIMGKITDITKDIKTIESMEDARREHGYSERLPWYMYDDGYANEDMSYRNSYDSSYDRRGRGRNAERDSMGRYSNDDDKSVQKLYQMMQSASDQERPIIQRLINQMQNK